ncbi:MAG: discoidin domain-containing protein [Verrucomicrobiia bacterium]
MNRRFGRPTTETAGRGQTIQLNFERATKIDHVILMEDISQGERVKDYSLEAMVGGDWEQLKRGRVIGHKQIIRFDPIEITAVRLQVKQSEGEPIIRKLAVYRVQPTASPLPR